MKSGKISLGVLMFVALIVFGASPAWAVCVNPDPALDGIKNNSEECDDDNRVGGDGCSADCEIETGFDCELNGRISACFPICGDGIVLGDEACDDGNLSEDDTCSNVCGVIVPALPAAQQSLVLGGGGCSLIVQ